MCKFARLCDATTVVKLWRPLLFAPLANVSPCPALTCRLFALTERLRHARSKALARCVAWVPQVVSAIVAVLTRLRDSMSIPAISPLVARTTRQVSPHCRAFHRARTRCFLSPIVDRCYPFARPMTCTNILCRGVCPWPLASPSVVRLRRSLADSPRNAKRAIAATT